MDLARVNLEEALKIRQALQQQTLATETKAGLAAVALHAGDLERARAHVAEIITYLDEGGSLDGTELPLRIYWLCYGLTKDTDLQKSTATPAICISAVGEPHGNASRRTGQATLHR